MYKIEYKIASLSKISNKRIRHKIYLKIVQETKNYGVQFQTVLFVYGLNERLEVPPISMDVTTARKIVHFCDCFF